MRLPNALLVLALGACLPLAAWGGRGHQLVAGLALRDLPGDVALWYQGQAGVVTAHASDPDHWKHDPREGPRHFLEVEIYGGADQVPTDMAEAVARAGTGFQKAGQVAWVIQDRVRDLAEAFKRGDRDQVVMLTAFLSHYVGDLHVPLHSSRNYDGQSTGQKGVHSRWETGLVDRMTDDPPVRPALLERDLFTAPWRWLREANALVPAVLEDDRRSDPNGALAGRHGDRSAAYWMLFQQRQGAVVKEQLARAGQHTAQMILLAWTLAGKPAAPVAAAAVTPVPVP